jgi:DNA-binding transcriptional regulator YdaS (Cro superfamily)
MTPIQRAVDLAGGQASLARSINTSASFVNQLVTGRRPVPATLCKSIEQAVGGRVTSEELRPDVFGMKAA